MKRTRLRPKPKAPMTQEAKDLREAWFRGVTKGKGCANCGRPGGVIEGHHIITKSFLKHYAKEIGEDPEQMCWGEEAQANGLPVCTSCHELHTRAIRPISRDKLPAAAIIWAHRWDLLWMIERTYPRGGTNGDSNIA